LRVLHKDLKKGMLRVVAESTDDMWLLYNVIRKGDLVRARTYREVRFGEKGSGRSSRVPMTLTLRVVSLEFQAFTNRLRIRGIVVEGPEKFGIQGKHHTINLDIGQEITIIKEEGWPRFLVDRLEKARSSATALVVAVDYDDYAIAEVASQGARMIASGSFRLPSKDDPSREEKLKQEVKVLAKSVVELIERRKPLVTVIAGPGFLKEYVAESVRALTRGAKVFTDTVSIGGEAGVLEEIRRGIIQRVLREAAIIEAERIIGEFERRLAKAPQLVAYTLSSVKQAAAIGAVDKALILDELLHAGDPSTRSEVEEVLRYLDSTRAEVHFISRESPAGLKLKGLGGIIALLRYTIPLHYMSKAQASKQETRN